MSITGFVKVFYMNYLLGLELSTATASTGDIEYSYDNDPDNGWISVASDDTTTETLTYEFTAAKNVDRILACCMNWKEFDVQYWDGAAYQDFTNVISKSGDTATTGIDYTDNSETTRYWEFDSVSTTKIRFQILKTITADEQKEVQEIYIGKEVGTFTDDILSSPNRFKFKFDDGSKDLKLSNQATRLILKGKKAEMKFTIKELWETADQDIISDMYSMREVAISLCGCDGTLYTHEGYRLQDFYNCVVNRPFMAEHSVGRDKTMGYDYKFELLEV